MLWIAFCDSGMLRKMCVDFSKINVNFQKIYSRKKKTDQKSQDIFHNICRLRDYEHNKKGNVLASKL